MTQSMTTIGRPDARSSIIAFVSFSYFDTPAAYRFENNELPTSFVVVSRRGARPQIVVAASPEALASGIRPGATKAEAELQVPGIGVFYEGYPLFRTQGVKALEILKRYTSQVAPFGPDEAWLDITGVQVSPNVSAEEAVQDIVSRIRHDLYTELGVHVSIGVSWNKTFARYAAEYAKPDGVYILKPGNALSAFDEKILARFPFMTRNAHAYLSSIGVHSIMRLCEMTADELPDRIGDEGILLRNLARGDDCSQVETPASAFRGFSEKPSYEISLGLSEETASRVKEETIIEVLVDTIVNKMLTQGALAQTIEIAVMQSRDRTFESHTADLEAPTNDRATLTAAAIALYQREFEEKDHASFDEIHLRASNLKPNGIGADVEIGTPADRHYLA